MMSSRAHRLDHYGLFFPDQSKLCETQCSKKWRLSPNRTGSPFLTLSQKRFSVFFFWLDTRHLAGTVLKRFNAQQLLHKFVIRISTSCDWRKRDMKASRILVGLGAVLILSACTALAQDTASITGTVRDPTGAIVPGAEVKLANTSISVTRAATTNADGAYLASGLPAGKYDLSVKAKGVKVYQAQGVVLEVAEKARVDVTLQVGQVSETVTVSGESVAQVETQTSDLSGVVTGTQISQLELNGRSFTKLITLVPGVSDQTGFDDGRVGLDANVSFSVNGGRTEYNNWQVDGANNMDTGSNATLDVFPNNDSIAEFRVFTSNYSAAYGRNGSGNVEVITKWGTNRFHGSVWEYLRNDFFNANDWFDNNAGNPRPAYKRHDFGFTIGGPVIFP